MNDKVDDESDVPLDIKKFTIFLQEKCGKCKDAECEAWMMTEAFAEQLRKMLPDAEVAVAASAGLVVSHGEPPFITNGALTPVAFWFEVETNRGKILIIPNEYTDTEMTGESACMYA